jgi:hypothetical protein
MYNPDEEDSGDDDIDSLEEYTGFPPNFPRRTVDNNPEQIDYSHLARMLLGLRLGRGIGNLADYGIGQSFDDILNMSFEQQTSSGPPPASKKELERLKIIKISREHVASNMECTVCKEKFKRNEECDLLPCQHFFHQDCIRPWLHLHNTCPICRFELLTDDSEYEAKKKRAVKTPSPVVSHPRHKFPASPPQQSEITPSEEVLRPPQRTLRRVRNNKPTATRQRKRVPKKITIKTKIRINRTEVRSWFPGS